MYDVAQQIPVSRIVRKRHFRAPHFYWAGFSRSNHVSKVLCIWSGAFNTGARGLLTSDAGPPPYRGHISYPFVAQAVYVSFHRQTHLSAYAAHFKLLRKVSNIQYLSL